MHSNKSFSHFSVFGWKSQRPVEKFLKSDLSISAVTWGRGLGEIYELIPFKLKPRCVKGGLIITAWNNGSLMRGKQCRCTPYREFLHLRLNYVDIIIHLSGKLGGTDMSYLRWAEKNESLFGFFRRQWVDGSGKWGAGCLEFSPGRDACQRQRVL